MIVQVISQACCVIYCYNCAVKNHDSELTLLLQGCETSWKCRTCLKFLHLFWGGCQMCLLHVCFGQGQFDDIINVTFSSSATVAMIVAVTLDNSLKASRKDRGLLWWDKFRNFGSDPRNLEFYRLPLGLNKFFPPTWCFSSASIILSSSLLSLDIIVAPCPYPPKVSKWAREQEMEGEEDLSLLKNVKTL